MGRAAEAVLSSANRRSQVSDIRRQTSSIQDTGVRAFGEPPDMRHVSSDRSGTPQPAAEATSSKAPSGSAAETVFPSRMRSENRSDFDPSRQKRHITRPVYRPILRSSPKLEPRHRPDAHLPKPDLAAVPLQAVSLPVFTRHRIRRPRAVLTPSVRRAVTLSACGLHIPAWATSYQ